MLKIISKIKEKKAISTYKLRKELEKEGYKITLQGLRDQERRGSLKRVVGLIVALKKISGVSWLTFGSWLEK